MNYRNLNIHFKGTFRPYQQRIIDKADFLLSKNKIHIVAAPGSGKTTLGLELILRSKKNCLILVPNITIREQWIKRLQNDFIDQSININDLISNSLKIKAPIICITYQSLYSAYKKQIDHSDDEFVEEIENYESFNLEKQLLDYNIEAICLDECHHLRNEWWKVLESIIKKLNNPLTISLTATPPYDSTTNEWKRYINLCGPIDEEIFVPELVNDSTLCPHQDYIYYNEVTDDEYDTLKRFYDNSKKVFEKYNKSSELLQLVLENNFYTKYKYFRKKYFQNATYYRALVLFLHHNNIKIPFMVKFNCNIEPFNISHLQDMLQYILFEDEESYSNKKLITSIKKELVALRLIDNRTVNLIHNEKISKIIIESKNKLNSICDIVKSEFDALKDNLRMLILADYIKKETKSSINKPTKSLTSIGILPIFESIRRKQIDGLNICLLSGSLVVLPQNCILKLKNCFEEGSISFKEINKSSFYEVQVPNNLKKEVVKVITSLFEEGFLHILIGTKALLGEGWDAPSVNTLILASFYGSYVSSNQMRGRAIRTKNNLNKVSNIWHLVTINPFDEDHNDDIVTLNKRFDSFMGLNTANYSIENGIERVLHKLPKTKEQINDANKNTLISSENRIKVKEEWDEYLSRSDCSEVNNEIVFDKKYFKATYSFYSTLTQIILTAFLFFNNYEIIFSINYNRLLPLLVFVIGIIAIGSYFAKLVIRMHKLSTKEKKIYYLCDSILCALKEIQIIKSQEIQICVKKYKEKLGVSLKNATTYEQNIFNDCLTQLFEYPDSPRYLLCRPKGIFRKETYIVPDLFKKNKNSATILKKHLDQNFGNHNLYFTKSENVKGVVLQARIIYIVRYKNLHYSQKRSINIKG